tara:strand:+ start:307 stop:549 length:243 start_codon:yes stop_codon:yes gene_type:complete
MKKEKETVFVYESKWHSLFNDTTTFGFLCGSVWFNYNHCGGNYFLNGVILVMFIAFVLARTTKVKKVNSKELAKIMEGLE